MRKYIAELLGTFMLVFLGTATVVIAKGGVLAIGLAFGLAITISAYAFGGISGGHFNPAVTTGMLINKRIGVKDAFWYIIFQILGAIAASAFVSLFVRALGLKATALGQTDFPSISAGMAVLVEGLITFLFVLIILNVTSDDHGNSDFAGLVIGITLAFLIIVALNLTGGSLNPARSIGPAIFAGGSALNHLWVYVVAPEVGAVVAAFCSRILNSEN
ncbi:glycerol uptake facilitator protein [Paucilactobacillus hokkaidonensis JCM 18461]|uniref:Glycerol uptake facilitator protein n=2 Tax=Paucilactobacillus hokkaidonensis TaxID=1193095 RepID=A0A0A1GVL2_9LACO|nr:aquaporin [Paucilactobacillus hokkaidonensis]KRO09386.1 MIP family glycerol uptake facilitator protein GlpF [Paucilactobacillus hokkaidonensis]BAP84893.1 glycerol uptake facilitator protein [Paucilactobacillus hokkaidonensis JCM 18461]